VQIDPRTPLKDIRLLRRAINGKWPITDEQRAAIVEKMMELVQTSEDQRVIVAAGKAVIDADKVNASRERTEKPVIHEHFHGGVEDKRAEVLSILAAYRQPPLLIVNEHGPSQLPGSGSVLDDARCDRADEPEGA
jgi:hypothetical protein